MERTFSFGHLMACTVVMALVWTMKLMVLPQLLQTIADFSVPLPLVSRIAVDGGTYLALFPLLIIAAFHLIPRLRAQHGLMFASVLMYATTFSLFSLWALFLPLHLHSS